VLLTVRRDGQEMTLSARLEARAGEAAGHADAIELDDDPGPGGDALGLVVADLSRQAQADLRIPADRQGVVVRDVVGLAPGADALAHGDIVVEVNRRPTPDVAAYRLAVESLPPGGPAWLFVFRPRPRGTFLAKIEVEGAQ
jgi:S1-C subfamily serine protease